MKSAVTALQDRLNFRGCSVEKLPLYATNKGLGRVALIATVLGVLLGFHFCAHIFSYFFLGGGSTGSSWAVFRLWSLYVIFISIFHLSEFYVLSVYNPAVVSADSFCINHSLSYTLAILVSAQYCRGAEENSFRFVKFSRFLVEIICAEFVFRVVQSESKSLESHDKYNGYHWYPLLMILIDVLYVIRPPYRQLSCAEFWIEVLLVPSLKEDKPSVFYTGLLLVVTGLACRLIAMATCGPSFDHIIQQKKKENHKLITHGIYQYLRHPSYFGWFYWTIGTQLLLCNPLSTVVYTVVGWNFFNRRIPYEEELLVHQYPVDYPRYMERTLIGIPFIRRYPCFTANMASPVASATPPH